MDPYQELISITAALKEARVPYAVCGGLALVIHGYPRLTKDVDILLRARDVPKAKQAIRGLGFILEASPMTFGHGTHRETRVHRVSKLVGDELLMVDMIEIEPGNLEVWKGRRTLKTDETSLSVVSREGLIAMKRRAGRPQDLADIHRLENGNDAEGN